VPLVSHAPSRVLPTILSCAEVLLEPLATSDLLRAAQAANIAIDDPALGRRQKRRRELRGL